jgi:diguanylate cyclase (GGDEF)-like protein
MTIEVPRETLLAIIAVQQEIVETHAALNDVMNVVARAAARLTAADAAVIELHEGNEMVYRAGAGAASGFVGLRLDSSNSLSGLCVALNQTLRADDCELDERVDKEACRRVGARSMLVTPLRFRGDPLGALKVYSSRVAAFDDVAAETLRLLVGLIAATMQRAREYEGLSQRALYDGLTGLANRDHLEAAIEAKIAGQKPFAVAFLDLNGFKRINDEEGHACGDRILKVVARRLSTSVRDCDIAARLGGDEFVVLLDGVDATHDAEAQLRRVLQHIAQPIADRGRTMRISATAGVAVYPNDAESPATLISVADSRMYAGKRA